MRKDREERLERYLLNADPFLWGIQGRRNKSDTYCWLKGRLKKAWPALVDFPDRAPYEDVSRLLIGSPGIEELTRGLIIPTVTELPVGDFIKDLRFRWMAGRHPDSDFLKERGLQEGQGWPFVAEENYPFVQDGQKKKYVRGWTQFAGVWFEEIEHLDD